MKSVVERRGIRYKDRGWKTGPEKREGDAVPEKMKDIFEESSNCRRTAKANRAAVIIDGKDYFGALHKAMRKARRSIMIVGWDIHSELRLVRRRDAGVWPKRLGRLIQALVKKRKDLRIYLLSWDFAMVYAMEREFFPRYKLKWRTHDRIRFHLDGEHPVGASQHQKLVVVDDAVAFAGGFDLSQWRWDASSHDPGDARRKDPAGEPYPPFHDVQMAVDGPAARLLGELARERWERAAGEPPEIDEGVEIGDPWPGNVTPDFEDVDIAVALTLPPYKSCEGTREAERLYLDSIAAARKFIYIENQYLSAYRIGEALKARLAEPDGPETVIVLPEKTGGWLEQHTMDVLRGRLLRKLRDADAHDRLRVYYPRVGVDPPVSLMVHAKVMIIDDCFLRVGSTNLSNRSLGLDSECDLAVAAEPGSRESRAVARIRNRLMAEHLGADADVLDEAVSKSGSLIAAVEAHRGGARTLMPLDGDVPEEVDRQVPDAELLDPEKPIEPDELFDYFVSPDQQPSAYRRLIKALLIIVAFLGLAAAWRWTPLGDWVDVDSAKAAARWIEAQPYTPLMVPAAYVIGGFLSFPVTLMIIATAVIFGPWMGLVYALLGAEISALVMFAAGRRLGRGLVRRYAGDLLNRLSRKLSDTGLIAVITFRVIPVAPFSVINVAAGASEIRFRDFALGSFIGLIPGTLAVVLVEDRILESLRHPGLGNFGAVAAVVAAAGFGLILLRRRLRSRSNIRPT